MILITGPYLPNYNTPFLNAFLRMKIKQYEIGLQIGLTKVIHTASRAADGKI
jgi:hypothetical protein